MGLMNRIIENNERFQYILFYIITKMVTIKNKISKKIIDKLRLNKEKVLSKEEIIKTIKEYQKKGSSKS